MVTVKQIAGGAFSNWVARELRAGDRLDVMPPTECLQVRTAQPTQEVAHLRRLLNEHLSRTTISAPANHLRLRSL